MTRARLTDAARHTKALEAQELGAFQWVGDKLACMTCGRSGWMIYTWMDACLMGHPYQCPCGREFSTKGGLSAHQNHRRTGNTCTATMTPKTVSAATGATS
jgi:hypothetical protein